MVKDKDMQFFMINMKMKRKRKRDKKIWPSPTGIWTPDFWTSSRPQFEKKYYDNLRRNFDNLIYKKSRNRINACSKLAEFSAKFFIFVVFF